MQRRDLRSFGPEATAVLCAIACTAPVWEGWYWTYDVMRPFVRPRQIAQQWLLGHLVPVWSTTAWDGLGSASLILYQKLFFCSAALGVLIGLPIGGALLAALALFMVAGFLLTTHAVRVVLAERHALIEASCGATAISCNFATSDWLIRGDFAEFAAQMLLPLLFIWCVRLVRDGVFSWSVGPVMAIITLAHSGTAAYCFIPIGCAVVVAAWQRPGVIPRWVRPAAMSLASFCLVLLPVALPALPMAHNSDLRWLGFKTPSLENVAMRSFFLPADHSTTWPPKPLIQIDPALLIACAAGVPLLIVSTWRGRRTAVSQPSVIAFLILVVAVVLAFQTRQALPVFYLLPGLSFIQFSWRLLTFSSVALVLLAAYVLSALQASRLRALLPVACAGMVLSTLPNKFEPARHHDARFTAAQIGGPDLGGGDAAEYTPRRPGQPISFASVRRLFALARAPTRCRSHWLDDMSRERAQASLDVTCTGSGSTSVPLFLAPGMRFEVDGRHVRPWRTCADPRPHFVLSSGSSRIHVTFPTWWSVMTDRAVPIPHCPAPASAGAPYELSS